MVPHDERAQDAPRPPPPARTRRTRGRPGAGSARGCAAPRRPCWTIWASSVSRADALGAHHEAARAVHGAARDPIARRLLHRDRLARHHRLVDRAPALEHHAVDGHALARPHAQAIAPAHVGRAARPPRCRPRARRRAVFGARPSSARMARRSCALRARSSSTWPSRTSVMITAAASKYTGGVPPWRAAVREDARAPAWRTRCSRTRPPVPSAISVNMFRLRFTMDCPAAHEEGPAAPEHDRRRQQRAGSRASARGDDPRAERLAGRSVRHRERNRRDGQDAGSPRTAASCRAARGSPPPSSGDLSGLERHAADRAGAGRRRARSPGAWGRPTRCASGSASTATGSSAIPHFGHAPGPGWRTSGSMGQV